MNHKAKHVHESYTEQVQIVMPAEINGFDRLFGGQLVEWIDVVAAVVARRHSGENVTTVSIDNLQFKAAARVNDTIILVGTITHVGNTSMEVRVETYVEALGGCRKLINKAYLVMVALEQGTEKPIQVPRLIIDGEEEQREWDAGVKRSELRKKRRLESY